MDRIIFGDNQFFGINHMSEEKAQALYERFYDLKAITDVLDTAYDCGIRGFMLNANERAKDICDYLKRNSARFPDLNMYPSLPYAHKYANLVNEKGIFGAIGDMILTNSSAIGVLGLLGKGALTLCERDAVKTMEILVDIEMRIFKGLNIKVVFLQNIVTDLLLGIGATEFFAAFADFVRRKYRAEPGFVTLNFPKLKSALIECGIENPIICSSINKIGHFMNPDITSYENAIQEGGCRPIAMSILASGAIRPDEAVEYVCGQKNIESIVFGASGRKHIEETVELIAGCSK